MRAEELGGEEGGGREGERWRIRPRERHFLAPSESTSLPITQRGLHPATRSGHTQALPTVPDPGQPTISVNGGLDVQPRRARTRRVRVTLLECRRPAGIQTRAAPASRPARPTQPALDMFPGRNGCNGCNARMGPAPCSTGESFCITGQF